MLMAKSFFKWFRRIFGNLYFLFFINGFLLASLFYFKVESNYENNLFKVIQKSIDRKIDVNDTKDSILVKIMQTCSNMLGNRKSVFAESVGDLDGFKTDFIHPATVDLMTANGACGSYALVLARIFQNYHYPVRIAQMKAYGRYGSHNVIEANINTQWVVLDPLFDTYFVKPGGVGLASFKDVKNNWDYYSKQLPQGYDKFYHYEDARYTNWGKIPVILPAIKKILLLFIGKDRVESMSLRVHFLRMYDIYFYVTLFIYIPILILTIRKTVKKKLGSQINMRVNFGESKKYIKKNIETAN
jgi:hypothetical protein